MITGDLLTVKDECLSQGSTKKASVANLDIDMDIDADMNIER